MENITISTIAFYIIGWVASVILGCMIVSFFLTCNIFMIVDFVQEQGIGILITVFSLGLL